MERVNIHLSKRQLTTLDFISLESGLKRAEIIRRALDEYIDKLSVKSKNLNYQGYTGTIGDFKR